MTKSYSVFVYKVLDVRLVIRKAAQYALAQHTVVAASAIPFAALFVYAYQRGQEQLDEIMSGTTALLLGVAGATGLAALRWRTPVLSWIDQ